MQALPVPKPTPISLERTLSNQYILHYLPIPQHAHITEEQRKRKKHSNYFITLNFQPWFLQAPLVMATASSMASNTPALKHPASTAGVAGGWHRIMKERF